MKFVGKNCPKLIWKNESGVLNTTQLEEDDKSTSASVRDAPGHVTCEVMNAKPALQCQGNF